MSEQIEEQKVDLIEDINEEQLEELAEDVEVDEELTEASSKKEAKEEEKPEAKVEVDDEEGEVEDDDEDEDDDDDQKSESKKKVAKEGVEFDGQKAGDETVKSINQSKPKTKAGMIKAIYDSVSKMKKSDLDATYEAMFDGQKAADEDEKAIKQSAADAAKANFKEDLDALVEGEETLTEDFRGKAAVIFEAAVNTKVSAKIEQLEEQYTEKLSEEVETVRSELVENVDGYLNYVVEQWMEQNEVAITNGLRTEIAENFIDSLKSVFVENYIEVPESKVDMVDELSEKVEELDEQLQKTIEDNIELAEKVAEYRKDEILREATIGMAETEVEKLRSLTEDLDFEDAESFEKKVSTIKESYFKVKTGEHQEELNENQEEEVTSHAMAAYLKALSKSK